jgi:signal transduction histidine kinase
VVTRHRGELKIASGPGEGSTFSIILDEAPQG